MEAQDMFQNQLVQDGGVRRNHLHVSPTESYVIECCDSLHNQNVDEIHQNQGESFPPAK